MSDKNDRGWNIVIGEPRSSLVASLLGASRSGELSLLDILIGLLLIVSVLHIAGFW
jgi:hypothetical protein